jgi:hypothetical protein
MAIIPEQKSETAFVTPQQKKQKQLLYALIFYVILIAAVFYFGFFSKSEPAENSLVENPSAPEEAAGSLSTDALVQALNSEAGISFSFLQDKKFQDLKISSKLPLTVGEKGRVNPFEPF